MLACVSVRTYSKMVRRKRRRYHSVDLLATVTTIRGGIRWDRIAVLYGPSCSLADQVRRATTWASRYGAIYLPCVKHGDLVADLVETEGGVETASDNACFPVSRSSAPGSVVDSGQ